MESLQTRYDDEGGIPTEAVGVEETAASAGDEVNQKGEGSTTAS